MSAGNLGRRKGTVILAGLGRYFALVLAVGLERLGFEVLRSRRAEDASKVFIETGVKSLQELRGLIVDLHGLYFDCLRFLLDIRLPSGSLPVPVLVLANPNDDPHILKTLNDLGIAAFLPRKGSPFFLSSSASSALSAPVNQRMYDRINTLIPAEFYDEWDRGLKGMITSLSEGGVFLQSTDPFLLDTKVDLRFFLPCSEKRILVKAKVIYSFKGSRRHRVESAEGMGIRFLEISHKDLDAIREYVSEAGTKTLV